MGDERVGQTIETWPRVGRVSGADGPGQTCPVADLRAGKGVGGLVIEAAVACASSDRPVPTTEPSAQLQPSPPVESARREPDWSPGWSRRDAPLMDPVSTREPAAGGATAAVLAKEADRRTHHVDAPRSSAWQRGSEPVQRATESAPRSRRGHPVVVHSTSSAALQRRQASLCGSPEGTSHTCSLV